MKNINALIVRENIIKSVREFFENEKFHEVVTPVLSKSLPLEPNIHPFDTDWKKVNGGEKLYLSTSPEAGLKKMLAAGLGNCFAIGHSFRNLEDVGLVHNPEFLMLEWYRQDASYTDIMDDCENLISYMVNKLKAPFAPMQRGAQGKQMSNVKTKTKSSKLQLKINYKGKSVDIPIPWLRVSLIDLFGEYAGLNLEEIIDDKVLNRVAKEKGYNIKNADWEQLFNQIFLNEIEPKLSPEPLFITDFPSRISPLCKPKIDKPYIAERFEFYLFGMELGNGNSENTDSYSVFERMKQEAIFRKKNKIDFAPIDEEFLSALGDMKSKDWAGVGLGLDRLAMILADVSDIRSF